MPVTSNLPIKDANSLTKNIKVAVDGGGSLLPMHALANLDGVGIADENPLPTSSPDLATSRTVALLTAAMVSDDTDLDDIPRAFRVYNGLSVDLTLSVIPANGSDPVPITILSKTVSYEPISPKRIRSTDSVNLMDDDEIAEGVEILLLF